MKNYKVTSVHVVREDNYEQGELEMVNMYDLQAEVEAANPMQAVEKYFADHLYWNFEEDKANVHESIVSYSTLVDGDNNEVLRGSSYYDQWECGQRILYTNGVSVRLEELVPVKFK